MLLVELASIYVFYYMCKQEDITFYESLSLFWVFFNRHVVASLKQVFWGKTCYLHNVNTKALQIKLSCMIMIVKSSKLILLFE